MCQVHASVVQMRRRLGGEAAAGAAPRGLRGSERVEWTHEERDALSGAGSSLAELVAARRGVLTSRGAESAPHGSLRESVVWRVASEEQAERQLLSFAAAATLSPQLRAEALGMKFGGGHFQYLGDGVSVFACLWLRHTYTCQVHHRAARTRALRAT